MNTPDKPACEFSIPCQEPPTEFFKHPRGPSAFCHVHTPTWDYRHTRDWQRISEDEFLILQVLRS